MGQQKTRAEVLAAVRSVVGSSYAEQRIQGRQVFCPACGDDITHVNDRPGRQITCPDLQCHYRGDEAVIFDQRMMWIFNDRQYKVVPPGELVHFSVGVKIQRDARVLLFRRTLHPVGEYTIPAGHLEQEHDPQKFAIQEAYEETGLGILSCVLTVDNQVMHESCRRSAQYHVWKLYTCESIGEPRMSYEADVMGWYTVEEIMRLPLTIPTRAILGGESSVCATSRA